MSENTVYLVTGANRGIGRGIVAQLLNRPSTTVIAATRDPQDPTSQSLQSLPKASSSTLITVKIDAGSETSAAEAIQTLIKEHSISKLDVVVANAGTYGEDVPVSDVTPSVFKEVFAVNVGGPLVLFQASKELLLKGGSGKGKGAAKFVVVGSIMGSLALAESWETVSSAYGVSKAGVNYLVRRIWRENEELVAMVVHPGWVQTRMGTPVAHAYGMEDAPVTVEGSAEGILKEIDEAERGETARYASFDHTDIQW